MPQKLLNIIELAERQLGLPDAWIEMEYQQETIGRFSLAFDGTQFKLHPKSIACLASDHCGISTDLLPKQNNSIQESCSMPGSGCC